MQIVLDAGCIGHAAFGRLAAAQSVAPRVAMLRAALTSACSAKPHDVLLDGDLARAEPKKLRYRLLHVAARITRTARQTRLAIADHWPWKNSLVTAFGRLAALPRPAG